MVLHQSMILVDYQVNLASVCRLLSTKASYAFQLSVKTYRSFLQQGNSFLVLNFCSDQVNDCLTHIGALKTLQF
jgi:hypothetical protein